MSRARRKRRRLKKQSTLQKCMRYVRALRARMRYPRYATIMKSLGETPLEAAERMRVQMHLPPTLPLSYAGRLDPMATGKLLILIGDECKKQTKYHSLDKEYEVEILFDVRSDSGDVLGIVESQTPKILTLEAIESILRTHVGKITLPYPHFSSKTIQGKPLHTWTLENRLSEIEIPKKTSTLYSLKATAFRTISKEEILATVQTKVSSIPAVTDARKKLGADFRRDDVRASWERFATTGAETYQILSITCIASSGTYMRSLAEHIAEALGTTALAYAIHRTKIGTYRKILGKWGIWTKRY